MHYISIQSLPFKSLLIFSSLLFFPALPLPSSPPSKLPASFFVYLGQRVKYRRIANSRADRLCWGEWEVRGDAAFPLGNTTLRIPAIIPVFVAWTTHDFFSHPPTLRRGRRAARRRVRPAPSFTLSSLPGQPDITPIFPHSFSAVWLLGVSYVTSYAGQAVDLVGWFRQKRS